VQKRNGDKIRFTYDAAGNRVTKQIIPAKGNPETSYYVRDASGNTMAIYKLENDKGQKKLRLKEQPIYGSKRVGVYMANAVLKKINANQQTFTRVLGKKSYEVTDHLGNVRVVVSDRKLSTLNSSTGDAEDFTAEVQSYSNYYPFGWVMPGRYFVGASGYRYMFNGKEADGEWYNGTGTSYDYGARLFNSRLGIWLGTDPKAFIFPGVSPYCYSLNNPVYYIDSDGQVPWPVMREFTMANGTTILRKIGSLFGSRFHPIKKIFKPHDGVDINLGYGSQDKGTPVYATHDGMVGGARYSGGAGNMVVINSPDGDFRTRYMHLENFAEGLNEGDQIREGQLIGYLGTTGGSTGPHLHYEIEKKNKKGRFDPINPIKYGKLIDPQYMINSIAELRLTIEVANELILGANIEFGKLSASQDILAGSKQFGELAKIKRYQKIISEAERQLKYRGDNMYTPIRGKGPEGLYSTEDDTY